MDAKRFWARVACVFTLFLVSGSPSSWAQENQYLKPLRFGSVGDGVDLLPMELDYDLESQSSLLIGDQRVDSNTFNVQMGLIADLAPNLLPYLTEEERSESYLILKWPEPLVTEGVLEAISQTGRVMWTQQVTRSSVLQWRDFLSEVRLRMKDKSSQAEINQIPMMTSTWALNGFLSKAELFVNSQDPFRFCLTQTTQKGSTRLCLPYMEFSKRDRTWFIKKTPEPIRPARVIVFQKQAPLKNRVPVAKDVTIQFLADLSEGHVYEFTSKPPLAVVEELTKVPKGAKIFGWGQVPTREHQVLNPLRYTAFEKAIGWEATIGDFREYWETTIAADQTELYFRGEAGGVFRQQMKITRIPREEARVFLHRRTPPATYLDGRSILGVKSRSTQVSSNQNSLVMTPESPDHFRWSFGAPNRGEDNRSYLLIEDGKEKFRAYYEAFKGYPGEVGFRMPLILGTGGNFLVAGEFAGNYWFDNLLGWDHYYLATQRWGVGVKYWNTLTPVKISSTSQQYSSALTTLVLDLKYRFTPGLWNRDESWGAIFGYNSVSYSIFKAPLLGVGGFWARSMPRVFDELFNMIPIFRYPKWVDVEFIYYAQSLNPQTVKLRQISGQSGGNWTLNFHGKVHWTKSFFGEGGFGIRSLDFTQENPGAGEDEPLRYGYRFGLLYGTFGLGYQF